MKGYVRLVALLLVLFVCVCTTARSQDRAGVVVGLQGKAAAVAEDGSERELTTGAEVSVGETVRTEAGSRLQLMLEDDSVISLGARTELTLDAYVYTPNVKEKNSLSLRIARGLARIISGAITELNPEQFKVRTSRATIGIRGCELGFECDGESHRYFVVRVPTGRAIHIISDLSGADLVLRKPALVEATADGRLRQTDLQDADIRGLIEQTTPKFVPTSTGQANSEMSQEATYQFEGEGVGASEPIGPLVEGVPMDVGEVLDGTTMPMNDPAQVVRDIHTRTVTGESGREALLPPEIETPPSPPSPPPPPLPLIGGGGIGGFYSDDAGWARLQKIYVFRRAAGYLSDGRSAVDFLGQTFDAAGNFLGDRFLSLRNVPLIDFGGRTAYENWRETHLAYNVRLANDNLQEFVRRVDFYASAAQILYWGIPAERFPGSALPGDSVVNYDVVFCEYPAQIPLPRTIVAEVRDAVLKINTKTRGYVLLPEEGLPIYGQMSDLKFLGRASQGVGASLIRGNQLRVGPNSVMGIALAGFRHLGSERSSQTGVSMWHGYAAGLLWTDNPVPLVYDLRTADIGSDNPVHNENRLKILLDRDVPVGAVAVDIQLAETPPATSPKDFNLVSAGGGVFVEGAFYATTVDNGTRRADIVGAGGGENWSWGVWEGEMEIDLGGGATGMAQGRGQYVAGDTLSPAAYQALVNGAQEYRLHTPADRPGHLAVMVSGPPDWRAELQGSAYLEIHIPGGGLAGQWRGEFNAADLQGNNLRVSYMWRNISANGHLLGTLPDLYQLNARGNAYTVASLVESSMTGNLVGPGAWPKPITGAIGAGRFTHGDGTRVNLTYGTDLAP